MDGFRGHHSAHHTCHEATGESLTWLGAGSFEEAGLQDLSPGTASRTHLTSGYLGTGTRWTGLRGVLVGVGLTCREPGAGHYSPGLRDTAPGFGNGHIPAQTRGGRPGGSGQRSPGLPAALKGQVRWAQEEPWFQRPGSESRSAAVLCLVSDSAHLLLLCESLPYVTCFTAGGSSWCSQHPCPTPWLGPCRLSTTLRPLRPPLHRLSLPRSCKPLLLP